MLSNGFCNNLNNKFSKAAANPEDAHVELFPEDDLDQIFCWEHKRQVKNDWTVQFNCQHYQIEKKKDKPVRAKQKITIREHMDGSVSIWSGKQQFLNFLNYWEIIPNLSSTRLNFATELDFITAICIDFIKVKITTDQDLREVFQYIPEASRIGFTKLIESSSENKKQPSIIQRPSIDFILFLT